MIQHEHDFITLSVPFAGSLAGKVDAALAALGNPAHGAVAAALDAGEFVHFMSITVVHEAEEKTAHLVLEASVDGNARAALERIAGSIGAELRALLKVAGIEVPAQSIGAYLAQHLLQLGPGWFATPGVVFSGTPGVSVGRIRREARLAEWIGAWLDRNRTVEPALQKLRRLRGELFEQVELKWAFIAEPVPLLAPAPSVARAVTWVLISVLQKLLWPLIFVPPIAAWISWKFLGSSPIGVFWDGIKALGAEVFLVAIAGGLLYWRLRSLEESDVPDERNPAAAAVDRIMRLEDRVTQNHLAGVSVIKTGPVRRLVLRAALWAVGALAQYAAQPGHLVGIGTIHFARWLILPGTDKLLFFSNYDGSWQSYLEDFIARAHGGLSAIWSNTRDFPKTANLVTGGASDGVRFKRWARRQQRPTPFWYSAYPRLTTERIRVNAAIRHGFAEASTDEAATAWLSELRFPSPDPALIENPEIPTLVFGGLSGLGFSHCLLLRLAGDPAPCHAWLRKIEPRITYGDQAKEPDPGQVPAPALVAAFTATGLAKFGVSEDDMASFPAAFQQGMSAPVRAHALGDDNPEDDPRQWWWGGTAPERGVDAALFLYAVSDEMLQAELAQRRQELAAFGHGIVHEVVLAMIPGKDKPLAVREPFGFVDGTSQPIMRGTRKFSERRNSIHAVEAGEIVLGYTDNLGNVAPTPRFHGRDLGRNGTYLVVRQLEQDTVGFETFLAETAASLAGDPRVPWEDEDPAKNLKFLQEWIAAKITGRWRQDGSSLVEHPFGPAGETALRSLGPDNSFMYGNEDPDGMRCPFGAHTRRLYPRDSVEHGSQQQIAIANRHRILRVGRSYGPQYGSKNMGLLFMCLNADIEGQFEFLQQTWMLGPDFHGLADEVDPLVGYRHRAAPNGAEAFTIPTPQGPLKIRRLKDFVTVRGGGYFFMPGRAALRLLT